MLLVVNQNRCHFNTFIFYRRHKQNISYMFFHFHHKKNVFLLEVLKNLKSAIVLSLN